MFHMDAHVTGSLSFREQLKIPFNLNYYTANLVIPNVQKTFIVQGRWP